MSPATRHKKHADENREEQDSYGGLVIQAEPGQRRLDQLQRQMAQMQAAVDIPVIASGGVTRIEDISRLAEAGLAGCIIGRALYEGTLSLSEAIRAASDNVSEAY